MRALDFRTRTGQRQASILAVTVAVLERIPDAWITKSHLHRRLPRCPMHCPSGGMTWKGLFLIHWLQVQVLNDPQISLRLFSLRSGCEEV
jgi:hypothetical protein